jgi:hypothetical protein
MLRVQSLVRPGEPVQKDQITGARPFPCARPGPGRSVRLHRKRQELALGRPAEHPRNPAVEETHDRLEYPVRRKRVASMNTEDTAVEAEHHRTVGMGVNPFDLSETEHDETIAEQQVQFLTRFTAYPLSRLYHSP